MTSSGQSPAIDKTCPVVLRTTQGECEILAFCHSLAGHQFVKGTVKTGETSAAAALRELHEEAGITTHAITTALGSTDAIQSGERWHFFVVQTDPLPDSWHHQCADDGGQLFGFFWHPVQQALANSFQRRYQTAFHCIRDRLALPAGA